MPWMTRDTQQHQSETGRRIRKSERKDSTPFLGGGGREVGEALDWTREKFSLQKNAKILRERSCRNFSRGMRLCDPHPVPYAEYFHLPQKSPVFATSRSSPHDSNFSRHSDSSRHALSFVFSRTFSVSCLASFVEHNVRRLSILLPTRVTHSFLFRSHI